MFQLNLSWGKKCDQNCSSLVTNNGQFCKPMFKNHICDTHQEWHFNQICIDALLTVKFASFFFLIEYKGKLV